MVESESEYLVSPNYIYILHKIKSEYLVSHNYIFWTPVVQLNVSLVVRLEPKQIGSFCGSLF